MEIIKLCTYLGLHRKIYDSNLSYDDNENTKLISSIQSEILPGSVINIILENINLNNKRNNKLYTQMIKFIENNVEHRIEIYIENFGDFRRLIITKNSEVKIVSNLHF